MDYILGVDVGETFTDRLLNVSAELARLTADAEAGSGLNVDLVSQTVTCLIGEAITFEKTWALG